MTNKPTLHIILTTLCYLLTINCFAQAVNFSDSELKRYLITENCVDTTLNGFSFTNDRSADVNGDGEIQTTEALQIKALEIKDFTDQYTIESLLDLNEFKNLNYLKIIDNDSLKRIEKLNLDSLKTLWISDGISLRYINISNLPNITTTLRIEGITTLDTLNIKNGTVANQFSLFYSQNIKYACVDSIPKEINEFTNSGAMMAGKSPKHNCLILTLNSLKKAQELLNIYPNPSNRYLIIDSEDTKPEVHIYSAKGKKVIQSSNQRIDVSTLSSGVYFLRLFKNDTFLTRKIIIQ